MATFVLLDPYPTTSVGPVSADLDDYVRNPMHEHGDLIAGGVSGSAVRVAGNTSTTVMYLSQTGDGSTAGDPTWVTTGIQGTTGSQGPQGIQGNLGIQGSTGAGVQGTRGSQGTIGASSTGIQGPVGTQGSSGGAGDVGIYGTPVDDQVAIWTTSAEIEGAPGLTFDGSVLTVTGDIRATGEITAYYTV